MDLQLSGKTALVTGSTAGIGYAIANLLAREGAEVIVNGRKQADVNEVATQLSHETGNEQVRGIAADFSKTEDVDRLLQELPDVDILVNNVGIFGEVPFAEITDEQWLQTFDVNVMSGVRLARHYFPRMLKKNEGRIIFISSESGENIPTEMIHYGVSKTAQLALSRGLARLTKGTNVTVNSVLPGPTMSRANEASLKEQAEKKDKSLDQVKADFIDEKRPTSLIHRWAEPEEVANMVAYVASPLSSATNGAALRVDGGVVNFIV
ncbi:SDR family NAD(P)-dependent oxidoreductase [Lewinella sp. IMCC34191]|uniref:SDR family NAD(P)-dependent oxidoreductase n=1 Tax=Lewinella sp. IMCC34191 TaxID=2259172 RepID=UPI000E27C15E|nr:SDR family oxidoreductase [Lewinella sp. IMCC34191]